jgi:hypothetical protein
MTAERKKDGNDPKAAEGWTWLHNSKKWHYFRGQKSLCGKFMLLSQPYDGYVTDDKNSPDDCAACRKKRNTEQLKRAEKVFLAALKSQTHAGA